MRRTRFAVATTAVLCWRRSGGDFWARRDSSLPRSPPSLRAMRLRLRRRRPRRPRAEVGTNVPRPCARSWVRSCLLLLYAHRVQGSDSHPSAVQLLEALAQFDALRRATPAAATAIAQWAQRSDTGDAEHASDTEEDAPDEANEQPINRSVAGRMRGCGNVTARMFVCGAGAKHRWHKSSPTCVTMPHSSAWMFCVSPPRTTPCSCVRCWRTVGILAGATLSRTAAKRALAPDRRYPQSQLASLVACSDRRHLLD